MNAADARKALTCVQAPTLQTFQAAAVALAPIAGGAGPEDGAQFWIDEALWSLRRARGPVDLGSAFACILVAFEALQASASTTLTACLLEEATGG